MYGRKSISEKQASNRGRVSWKKFAAAFADSLGDVGEQLSGFGRLLVTDACKEYIADLDRHWPHSTSVIKMRDNGTISQQFFGGDHDHPWYFGQLHDSIFVRVADKNRTVAICYMPQRATLPQTATAKDAGQKYDNIVGAEFAAQMAHNAQYVFLPGIQMELFVSVPYARKVNESTRHKNFMNVLRADFFSDIEDRVQGAFEDNPRNRTRVFTPRK